MFGIFKKKKIKPSGKEMAEEGLKQIALAIKNNWVSIEAGKVYRDIYVYADSPDGIPRVTYVMFSPTVQNQVIARCAIVFSHVWEEAPVWQIDWAVLEEYRGKRFGVSVVTKALAEFTKGMAGKQPNGFFIEAVVDEGNYASSKIASSLIGNEEVIFNEEIGSNIHSFRKKYNA